MGRGSWIITGVCVVLVALMFLLVGPRHIYNAAGFGRSPGITTETIHKENGAIVGGDIARQSQPAKRLWDWMQLLIIPAVLAVAAYKFNHSVTMLQDKLAQQRENIAREIEDRREKEARLIERRRTLDNTLQSYLDEMAQFLLYREDTLKKLVRVTPEPGVQSILRARTLAVLDGLVTPEGDNPDEHEPYRRRKSLDRKRSLLQFLHEAGLIEKGAPTVRLEGANLREAYLREALLRDAELKGADFGEADLLYADFGSSDLSRASMGKAYLRGANLEDAILEEADLVDVNTKIPTDEQQYTYDRFDVNLKNAVLTKANLSGSDLRGADLTGATLDGAELDEVNLRNAEVKDEQLAKCGMLAAVRQADGSLAKTFLPDGSSYEWSEVRPVLTDLLNGVSFPVDTQGLIGKAQHEGRPRNLIVGLMRLENNNKKRFSDIRALEDRIEEETMYHAPAVWVELNCASDPEKTTVTNRTEGKITVRKITSVYRPGAGEPKVVNRELEPGKSITFESGTAAKNDVLLNRRMYNNAVGSQDGAIVYTSVGRSFARC